MNPDAAAYQQFLGACRGFWAGPMFHALQAEYAADAAGIAQHPTYAMFAWFERHVQRMKYGGSWGLVASAEQQRDALLASLAAEGAPLALDPALRPPTYWTGHDIHQHPGGLAGELAGFIYQEATGSGGVVGQPQMHDRFAQAALAGRAPIRILDLGCGYGRSAWAFAEAAPGASVVGVDLSESCLRLASSQTPPALRSRIRFVQADAAGTLPDGPFDLVTSTMLLHELPDAARRAVIGRAAEVLAPGGAAVHLDFLPPADTLLRLLYDGHSLRNNEPFMRDLAGADLDAEHRSAGFGPVQITPFAETDGVLDAPPQRWRLPWTIIAAEKPQQGATA